MRKIVLVLPFLLLGCNEQASNTASISDEQRETAEHQTYAHSLIDDSVVECSDGNQVRVASRSPYSNSAVATIWTILDRDGKPKRCGKDEETAPPPPMH